MARQIKTQKIAQAQKKTKLQIVAVVIKDFFKGILYGGGPN